jgi:ABC-type multidrug transport system fused ATPase/permease subunit
VRRESTSFRLLKYLRPYRGRLIVTALLMVGFAFSSGITIGMISPFVKVLFTPRPAVSDSTSTLASPAPGAADAVIRAVTGGSAAPPAPQGHGIAARFTAWKQSLRTWFEHFFLTGSPLRSLTRICLALLVVFLIKNLFDYLTNVLTVWVEQAVVRETIMEGKGVLRSELDKFLSLVVSMTLDIVRAFSEARERRKRHPPRCLNRLRRER